MEDEIKERMLRQVRAAAEQVRHHLDEHCAAAEAAVNDLFRHQVTSDFLREKERTKKILTGYVSKLNDVATALATASQPQGLLQKSVEQLDDTHKSRSSPENQVLELPKKIDEQLADVLKNRTSSPLNKIQQLPMKADEQQAHAPRNSTSSPQNKVSSTFAMHLEDLLNTVVESSADWKVPVPSVEYQRKYDVQLLPNGRPDQFWLCLNDVFPSRMEHCLKLAYCGFHSLKQAPKVGAHVVCLSFGKYCRARVTQVTKGHNGTFKFELLLLDYGTFQIANMDQLYPLTMRFCAEPAMALLCSLRDIRPRNGSWPMDALMFFAGPYEKLTAIFYSSTTEAIIQGEASTWPPCHSAMLHRTEMCNNFARIVDLNSALVQRGWATSSDVVAAVEPVPSSVRPASVDVGRSVPFTPQPKPPTFSLDYAESVDPVENADPRKPHCISSRPPTSQLRFTSAQSQLSPVRTRSMPVLMQPFPPQYHPLTAPHRAPSVDASSPPMLTSQLNPLASDFFPSRPTPIMDASKLTVHASVPTVVSSPLNPQAKHFYPLKMAGGSVTTVAALEATLLPPKADKAEPVDPSNVDELLQMAPQEGSADDCYDPPAMQRSGPDPALMERYLNTCLQSSAAGNGSTSAGDGGPASPPPASNDSDALSYRTADTQRSERLPDEGEDKAQLTAKAPATFQSYSASEEENGEDVEQDAEEESVTLALDQQPKTPEYGETFQFWMSCIHSPTSFFVQVVEDEDRLQQFQLLLNELYASNPEPKKPPQRPKVDSHWVVEDVHRRWSRVRVLDSPEPRRCDAPVRVLHVDYGHVTHVATRQLRHLMPQAAAQPYAALFCKLVDVRPTGTSVRSDCSENEDWSSEAVAEFVRLTAGGDQPLTAVSAGIDPTLMALQLIILDGEERSSVNESLVHQGLALSTAFEPPDILELYLPEWDPMASDFYSARNRLTLDTENYDSATTGYVPQDDHRICRFYRATGNCHKGNRCGQLHADVDRRAVTSDEVEAFGLIPALQPVLPDTGTFVELRVGSVLASGLFYAVLTAKFRQLQTSSLCYQDQYETIDTLQAALQKEYTDRVHMYRYSVAPYEGDVVVALNPRDGKWSRGRVLDTLPGDLFHVLFFDLGFDDWVHANKVCKPLKRYLYLPAQSFECRLNGVDLTVEKTRAEFVRCVAGRDLVALVIDDEFTALVVDLFLPPKNSGDAGDDIADLLVGPGQATSTLRKRPAPRANGLITAAG